jgi:hypothetical protein
MHLRLSKSITRANGFGLKAPWFGLSGFDSPLRGVSCRPSRIPRVNARRSAARQTPSPHCHVPDASAACGAPTCRDRPPPARSPPAWQQSVAPLAACWHACVIQPNWTPKPPQTGHAFHAKLDTSGATTRGRSWVLLLNGLICQSTALFAQ